MATVKCQWEERIGDGFDGIIEVTEKVYKIPDRISCPCCHLSANMFYNSYRKEYECKNLECGFTRTVKSYLLEKLEVIEQENKAAKSKGREFSPRKDLIIL